MTIDEQLRDALAEEAERIEPAPGGWDRIVGKVAVARRRRRARRAAAGVLGAAAVVALVLGVLPLVLDDPVEEVHTGPADRRGEQPVTTSPPTTAVHEPSEGAAERDPFPGIWPFTSREEAKAYDGDEYRDPGMVADAFATRYLGMTDPLVGPLVHAEGAGHEAGVVEVRAREAGPVTSVSLQAIEGDWVVVGAATDNIVVSDPMPGSRVAQPVLVAGEGTAFEGNILVAVRQDGQLFGETLGETYVTAGGNGEMGLFGTHITIDPPTRSAGAVVLWTDSAMDGSVQEATVVRIAFGSEERSGGLTRFSVFFHQGEDLVARGRETGQTVGVLRAALESLFAGPTSEERAEGVSSLFSDETADLLAGVSLTEDGTAIVDLRREVNNASTSAGSVAFRAELDATVFQFSTVRRIEYRLRGSCDAFYEWMQAGGCRLVERPEG